MDTASWKHKSVVGVSSTKIKSIPKGRGRSRKRSRLYNSLASYHSTFLYLLTSEFRAEESSIRDRIEAASENPIALEDMGQALFDMLPERRGNIFSDEVYRLSRTENSKLKLAFDKKQETSGLLPSSHKFSQNDVVMVTLQPAGCGDFFGPHTMPTRSESNSIEARVLSTGPTYIDVAINAGLFESNFGPSPNNLGPSGKGDPNMRLRIDRYFSNVPYNRMVAALGQITSIPDYKSDASKKGDEKGKESSNQQTFDECIRQAILFSYSVTDKSSTYQYESESYDLSALAKRLAKPPMKESPALCNQVLGYLQSNPHGTFPKFNGPQLSAIGASLTRRMTMIQGPPGTGKTTIAASIVFGFVHQCRHLPGDNKVLATAFSNVGADNLAEQALKLGLKVLRLGKASAVSQMLWDYTLDAAIDRDPTAQKALEDAAKATTNLRLSGSQSNGRKGSGSKSRVDLSVVRGKRDAATKAVKASIEACNVAATKAMRDADVIICTSIGAADSRLLRACGILLDDEEETKDNTNTNENKRYKTKDEMQYQKGNKSQLAPDGLPPLSLPFIIIDEACQSIEPATLIPLISTDSCRSLVMLGDPCQLPPTVISDHSGNGSSPLSISLMSRLASSLPQPVIMTAQGDKSDKQTSFLDMKETNQAVSFIKQAKSDTQNINFSYRKSFPGALLLSVQYRMHPSIAAFSSAIFYGGLLSSPSFLSSDRIFPEVLGNILPSKRSEMNVRLVNVGGCSNESKGSGILSRDYLYTASTSSEVPEDNISYSNKAEAIQVISLLKNMMSSSNLSKKSFTGSIGVITPYASQSALLKSMMASDPDFRILAKDFPYSIEVNSVDGFQGRECDAIIFSSVRSNRQGKIGFLSDWRRMNVALTRAKYALIIFGDVETLKAGDVHWNAFCTWCERLGCASDAEVKDGMES